MTLFQTGIAQTGMGSVQWLRPDPRRIRALRECRTPVRILMSRFRSGIDSGMLSPVRSSIPVLHLCTTSVLSQAGKFQQRTGSALPSPPSLCSARGWLTSRRSARKNPGTLPAGRRILKIAAPHLRNTLVRLPCSLPGPAGTRMFPVGTAAESLSPLRGHGIPVLLGSMRLILT